MLNTSYWLQDGWEIAGKNVFYFLFQKEGKPLSFTAQSSLYLFILFNHVGIHSIFVLIVYGDSTHALGGVGYCCWAMFF